MTEERLYNYVSGQADENEVQAVQSWASESEKRKKELARLKNVWIVSGLQLEINSIEKEHEISQIQERIRELSRNTSSKSIYLKVFKYAAAVIFIVSLSGTAGYFLRNYQLNLSQDLTEIIVPYGERSNIILPDGSTVQLNSGSSLKFESSFFANKRMVKLEGEAFFEVTQDKSSPFVVETSNLQVEVLGTKFNISSYSEDAFNSTYLKSGKVKVRIGDDNEILLNPSEVLEFDKFKNQYSKTRINDERFTDWTKGILTIKGETIEELSKKLTRRFGVKISFGDEEAKKHTYTGSIKDEDLDTVLKALRFASLVDSKRDGNHVKLYSIK